MSVILYIISSDVIKDFVLEDKDKARDTGPADEDKDLQK